MPVSLTFSISDANASRAVPALEREFGREGSETDKEMASRYLRLQMSELVFRHERRLASGAVSPDDILEETP